MSQRNIRKNANDRLQKSIKMHKTAKGDPRLHEDDSSGSYHRFAAPGWLKLKVIQPRYDTTSASSVALYLAIFYCLIQKSLEKIHFITKSRLKKSWNRLKSRKKIHSTV